MINIGAVVKRKKSDDNKQEQAPVEVKRKTETELLLISYL